MSITEQAAAEAKDQGCGANILITGAKIRPPIRRINPLTNEQRQYTRENENRMAGCALPIFAVGQYNRWCCQTFDNISLQNAVEQKSYQRHLQISHDIHLTEKQVLMKAKLILQLEYFE